MSGRSPTGPLAVGVDLGTSSLKVVAVDERGRCVAQARAGYPTAQPEPDAAEQDPSDWLIACDTAIGQLATVTDPSSWLTIGLSGMMPTLVSIAPDGTPVGPAITWKDGRAEPEGRSIAATVGPDALYRRTGQRVDGRYLLAMHARRVRLGLPSDTIVAGAKDFLLEALTGELLTDPSTASGYGAYDLRSKAWDDAVLAAAGVTHVPAVVDSRESRPLSSATAARWGCRPGIPVVVGAADSVLGAHALGVRAAGDVAYIAGTSNVILGWSASPRVDEAGRYLVTPMASEGYGLEMDLLATGSAMEWLAGLLGVAGGPAALAELAATADLASAPLVLPYFSPGEQGALWDPRLTGAVEGLTLRTTAAELARGLLAGIVLESSRCLDVLEHASGRRGTILMSGSGAAAQVFRQDLADATGRTVSFDRHELDHSAVGAALLAGHATLHWPETTDSAGETSVVEPDPAQAKRWAHRFERHDAARQSQTARRDERST
ncbi:FGGY-family carbohydrate kinase [Mycobacterium yunnanensis]|uniref:FGGY-family carbohydrate kinase n=1 Tax=Mycobacterium yunnanensis TaxID=368477 RepID=A0A9X3BZX0_9MYCO|nr:FGGY-family carbohydrate kinase [Mycobacterium yunnanensis]MCV7420158.1 FGGY-family carbohydrate kinase [Mycobacterium yunnanensis]